MALNQRGDPGFTLAGFLLLAALGASLWKAAPLESVRPSGGQTAGFERQYSQQIPARLWQDPFKAVYTHEHAVADSISAVNFAMSPGAVIRDLNSAEASETELTILAVMLSPGAYPELEERRRRRRYAVLAGLGEESFVPRNAEALNVFYLPKDLGEGEGCTAGPGTLTADGLGALHRYCFAVPFEWFDYEEDKTGRSSGDRRTLLLWLDESRFVAEPLTQIRALLEELIGNGPRTGGPRIAFNLLGPARSDALRNLVNAEPESSRRWFCDGSGLAEFNILSPTATVADSDLTGRDPPSHVPGAVPAAPLQRLNRDLACDEDATSPVAMQFLRVIQSDDALIRAISAELKNNRQISAKDDHVVLISEWDTYFGRALPRAFLRYFCKEDCDEQSVVQFSYLRGIDGIVAGDNAAGARTQGSGGGGSPAIDMGDLRRPVGTGQFDYLRRLASLVRQQDRQWQLESGHGVSAVVLLGSDVYDKLLILRALRPELPGALFATTDLDAQFLHPSEYSWARSLIVASTYGLATSPNVPMSTMPFRDSYQTSVYLATRMVFNKADSEGLWLPKATPYRRDADTYDASQSQVYARIPPQLFEIGRQQLVPLNGVSGEYRSGPSDNSWLSWLSPRKDAAASGDRSWNLNHPDSHSRSLALGFLFIAMLGIFALHQLRPMSGRIVLVASGMLLVFTLLAIAIGSSSGDGLGEPTDILSGVSVWPAVFLRVLAGMLALVFMWSVCDRLHRNWQDLGNRYFALHTEVKPEGITVRKLVADKVQAVRRYLADPSPPTMARLLPVLMIGALFLVMRTVMTWDFPLEKKLVVLFSVFLGLIGFWWATIYGKIWPAVKVRSINRLEEICGGAADAAQMWRIYGEYGTATNRFLRTTGYLLVYFAVAAILFTLLGAPSSPCRGEFACGLSGATTGVSVLLMLLLLFLVVDAARLCICWVDAMRNGQCDWGGTELQAFVQLLKLPESHAKTWMVIHLVGERTAEVTRLIYYPVLIILLMLVSRSTYFDSWDFPQALAIIIGVNFAIALGSIARLNHVARSAREELIRRLQEEVLAADKPAGVDYQATPSERNELIKQLESLRIGAYLRIWDQPPVRATLMLLGGAAMTYAEYLSVLVN